MSVLSPLSDRLDLAAAEPADSGLREYPLGAEGTFPLYPLCRCGQRVDPCPAAQALLGRDDLGLHLAPELQRLRDQGERLPAPTGPDDRDGSIAEKTARKGLVDPDRLDLAQQSLLGVTFHQADLGDDALVGDGKFRCEILDR